MSDDIKTEPQAEVKMEGTPVATSSEPTGTTEPPVTSESSSTALNTSATPAEAAAIKSESEFEVQPDVVKIEGMSEEEVKELLNKAAKQEGWVPISTIITFKRMKEFQKYGVPFVAAALRQKAASEGNDPLVAISDGGENVRRKRPLEPDSTAWARSVYVKGFGDGETGKNSQTQLEAYFEKFAPINALRRRRGDIEDQGARGKGKGPFKGSVFVEFKYERDAKRYLASTEPEKFCEDLPELVKMSKDDYVIMKAREKGIPEDEISKGGKRNSDMKWSGTGNRFNAFREMAKLKTGGIPQLAKIDDSLAVVGTPAFNSNMGGKRSREEDEQNGPSKHAKKVNKTFTLTYHGVDIECDRQTGLVVDADKEKVKFDKDAVIRFTGGTDSPDWKDLKAKIVEFGGIPTPFMAFPPGSTYGSLAKTDDKPFSDEEVKKLNDAKLQFGGKDTVWTKISDEDQRNFWVTRANFQGKLIATKLAEAGDSTGYAKGERKFYNGGRGRGSRGRGSRGRGSRGRGGDRGGSSNDATSSSGVPPTVQAS